MRRATEKNSHSTPCDNNNKNRMICKITKILDLQADVLTQKTVRPQSEVHF